MGCSNPHPHGQVWSLSAIPTLPATELGNLKRYSLTDVPPSSAPKGSDGLSIVLVVSNCANPQQGSLVYCANTLMLKSL